MEDVNRYHTAIRSVSAHIIGDGRHAKRLRFLADAVGLPTNEEIEDSLTFRMVCRKGAYLAHKMALCQDQIVESAIMMETCEAAMALAKEEISRVECGMS